MKAISADDLLVAKTIFPRGHNEPLCCEYPSRAEFDQLCRQIAPDLIDAFNLKAFALGAFPHVCYNVVSTTYYPATAIFAYTFLADYDKSKEPVPSTTRSILGWLAETPDCYIVAVEKAELLLQEVFARRRHNSKRCDTTLVGLTEIRIHCGFYLPCLCHIREAPPHNTGTHRVI